MNNHDDQLHQLLKQWPGIDPPGSFDADVRRRIRLAQAKQPANSWLTWLWRPAFSLPVTVLVGVAIGIAGAFISLPERHATPQTELTFMAPTTLAGAVLYQEVHQ